MKVIPPLTVTGAMLTSSTVAEPDTGETAWNAATSYSIGTEVIRTSTHTVYTSLATGVDAGTPETTPSRWAETRPTNRWAMFDLLRNSQTSETTTLSVVLTPGTRIDSIALVGVQASTITITVKVGATVYYTRTVATTTRSTTSWYTYLIGAFRYAPSVALFDLPPITGCTITIAATGGDILIGGVVMGRAVDLGMVIGTPVSGASNFSRIERDVFGNITLVPRRSVPNAKLQLLIDKTQVDALRTLRTDLNAVPALWSGLDDRSSDGYFESLLLFGPYKVFDISLDHVRNATVNLELEEM